MNIDLGGDGVRSSAREGVRSLRFGCPVEIAELEVEDARVIEY
jgi:hypothetical protein